MAELFLREGLTSYNSLTTEVRIMYHICFPNQWTDFCMIVTSVMKELMKAPLECSSLRYFITFYFVANFLSG